MIPWTGMCHYALLRDCEVRRSVVRIAPEPPRSGSSQTEPKPVWEPDMPSVHVAPQEHRSSKPRYPVVLIWIPVYTSATWVPAARPEGGWMGGGKKEVGPAPCAGAALRCCCCAAGDLAQARNGCELCSRLIAHLLRLIIAQLTSYLSKMSGPL